MARNTAGRPLLLRFVQETQIFLVKITRGTVRFWRTAKKAVFSEISQFVRVLNTFDYTLWSFGEKPAKTAGKILCGFSLAGGIVSA